jgi:RNA polymerase sigma factor (sigma-70 family)
MVFTEQLHKVEKSITYFSFKLASQSSMEFDDAKQEMLLAVWQSSKKFDPAKGAFTTFAVRRMRNRMKTLLDKYINSYNDASIEDDGEVIDERTATPEDEMLLDDIQERLASKATNSICDERAYTMFVLMRGGCTMGEVAQKMDVRTSWLSRLFNEKIRRVANAEVLG